MSDANEQFEADAKRFYVETHILAPGKSEPRTAAPDSFTRLQLRGRLWNLWSLKEQQLAECKAKALREAADHFTLNDWVGDELRRMAEAVEREAKT